MRLNVPIIRAAALLGGLFLSAAAPAAAQQRAPSPFRAAAGHAERGPVLDAAQVARPAGPLVLGGVVGGLAGALAGGALGGALSYALVRCDDQDGCLEDYVNAAFNGAVVGASIGIPLGVHRANDRQGRLRPALLTSAAIGALGLGGFWAVQKAEGPDALMGAILVATPVLQIARSVAIERRTSGQPR
jgi:hypothetical protein